MRDEMHDWTVLVCGPCWHELVTESDGTLNKKIWERTRPDIMIEIHLPNIEKGSIRLRREDLSDDHSQPQIRRHEVYKIAKDSDVYDVLPNVFAVVDSQLERTLDPQTDIIRTHSVYVGVILKSLWNFGRQRSHVCG